MTDAYEDLLEETRQRLAHLQGELAELREQLAASLASEAQLRQELETARVEAALNATELAHAQRQAAQQEEGAQRRIADLESRLAEARRLQERAESERAAVIGALGRRARRQIGQLANGDASAG